MEKTVLPPVVQGGIKADFRVYCMLEDIVPMSEYRGKYNQQISTNNLMLLPPDTQLFDAARILH